MTPAQTPERPVTPDTPTPPYRVRQGGLMRCCLQSLDNQMCDPAKNPPREGDVLNCEYEADATNAKLRFRDGAWEWNHV